jgi:hypothetical protein
MPHVCFNDCFSGEFSKHLILESLIDSLEEYKDLKQSYPEEIQGIVTSQPISVVNLSNHQYSIYDLVSSITDKDLRNFGYKVFTKYPVDNFFDVSDEEDLLAKEYVTSVAGVQHSAINHVIVYRNEGVMFSLGVHDDLRVNVLSISSNSDLVISVTNLFGLDSNTQYVKNLLEKSKFERLENFERFLSVVGENVFSARFKRSFELLPSNVQISIIEHFERAIRRNGASPLFSDGDLIKDVTPENAKYRLYELRIFDPVAMRVYFYETTEKIYLALVERKPQPKKQNSDINAAYSIIKQWILMGA